FHALSPRSTTLEVNESWSREASCDTKPGEDEMSKKTIVAGAAVGLALPAAVGAAKKLIGEKSTSGEARGESRARSRDGAAQRAKTSASRTSSRARRSTRSAASSARSTASSARPKTSRTKEQLYREAKRL